MHRSGTSLLAEILDSLGVYLGDPDDMLVAAGDNQRGFWENTRFLAINIQLLALADAAWDYLPPGGVWPSMSQEVVREANDLVDEFSTRAEVWGWKDPRTSLLMRFWRDRLEGFGVEPKLIVVLRHPFDVAESLNKRNGFSWRHSLNLWVQYNRELYYQLQEVSSVVVPYDALFSEGARDVVERLAKFAGLSADVSKIDRVMEAIRPDLRHSATDGVDDLRAYSPQAHEIYMALLGRSNWVEERPVVTVRGDQKEAIDASVIIPVMDGLEHTQACIDSVMATMGPARYEIIVIDNGSADGTEAYLRRLSSEGLITALRNNVNRGFAGAINQGLALARGEVCILLNNDAIVTPGWYAAMLVALRSNPRTGLVGAMSNSISGYQLVRGCSYQSVDEMLEFAASWATVHHDQSTVVKKLTGFCLMIDRAVLDELGGFDERFFPGNFEDDDYGMRAQMAGFELRIARAAFVHHAGSVTFSQVGGGLSESLLTNWERFKDKWGLNPDLTYGSPYSLTLDPDKVEVHIPLPIVRVKPKFVTIKFGGKNVPEEHPTVSLCMIVRDEAHNLEACVRPLLDAGVASEVIVVDTGSTDDTVEVAQALGDIVTVRHFDWMDDFSEARNFSIEGASGEWVLWMDADDRCDELTIRQIRQAAAATIADAYMFKIRSRVTEPDGWGIVVSGHLRMFRNGRGVRFQGAVHEDPTRSALECGLVMGRTDITVDHVGYEAGRDVMIEKAERNRNILIKALAAEPGNLETRYQLAVCSHIVGDLWSVVEHAGIVIDRRDGSPRLNSIGEIYQLYTILITAYMNIGETDKAFRTLHRAVRLFENNRHLWTMTAMLLLSVNDVTSALDALARAESMPEFEYRQWPEGTIEKYRQRAMEKLPPELEG